MLFEIKSRWTGAVLFKLECGSLKLCVEAAITSGASLDGASLDGASLVGASLRRASLDGASLRGASLDGASLRGASLDGASLRGASLRRASLDGATDLVLPTGETWEQYLTETVPALLTAGGKALESFGEHFACHAWDNCPMAHAFDTHDLDGVPLLLRPRADQFIQFFDAKQIPWPLPTKAQLAAARAEAAAKATAATEAKA